MNWQMVPTVLEAEEVRAELLAFAAEHNPRMSADEFLGGLGLRTQAAVGRAIAKKLGIRSLTEIALLIERPPVLAVLALMCGMAAEGVRITDVTPTVDGAALELVGVVPSTALHYEGTMSWRLTTGNGGVEAQARVVFPGQLVAYGAGRRLIRRVEGWIRIAGERLGSSESVRQHLATTV